LVVAPADVALVVEGGVLARVVGGQCLLDGLHCLYRVLTDLLLEDLILVIRLWLELILLLNNLAHVEDQLLFDSIGILSHLQRRWHQLVLGELHAEALAQLDGIGDVLDGARLADAGAEHESGELVVI